MNTRRIHIGNVKIHLPQSAAGSARHIADGIGNEILRSIVEATRGRQGTMRLAQVSAGKITAAGGTSPERLQKQIAGRVAAELRKRFE